MRSVISSINWHSEESPENVEVPHAPLPPSPWKNILPVMLVDTSANDKIEFTVLKILIFILLVILCI